jgi:hypothetical protein
MKCIFQTQGITYPHPPPPTPNPLEIYQGFYCALFIGYMTIYFENYLFIILNLNLMPFLKKLFKILKCNKY